MLNPPICAAPGVAPTAAAAAAAAAVAVAAAPAVPVSAAPVLERAAPHECIYGNKATGHDARPRCGLVLLLLLLLLQRHLYQQP